ncbi:hypothetical protein LTR17_026894, partial [Elasticomyces elasticus]
VGHLTTPHATQHRQPAVFRRERDEAEGLLPQGPFHNRRAAHRGEPEVLLRDQRL